MKKPQRPALKNGGDRMKHRIRITLLMAALLQSALAAAADPTAPAGSAAHGRELFMQNMCYSCHGTQGQGGERGSGPRLAPDPFPFVAVEMQLRTPRGVMPRYPEQFVSRLDVADIYA